MTIEKEKSLSDKRKENPKNLVVPVAVYKEEDIKQTFHNIKHRIVKDPSNSIMDILNIIDEEAGEKLIK